MRRVNLRGKMTPLREHPVPLPGSNLGGILGTLAHLLDDPILIDFIHQLLDDLLYRSFQSLPRPFELTDF